MIEIRPATDADVNLVLPMVSAIGRMHESADPARYGLAGNPGPYYEPWLRRRAVDPRSVFLVGERTEAPGGLAAFLIATVMRDLEMYKVGEYGFIHDLWVEPQYRNEGVGRQMTMLAVERFRQIGVTQVRLDVWSANEPALKLYESCGFRVCMVQMICELTDSR